MLSGKQIAEARKRKRTNARGLGGRTWSIETNDCKMGTRNFNTQCYNAHRLIDILG